MIWQSSCFPNWPMWLCLRSFVHPVTCYSQILGGWTCDHVFLMNFETFKLSDPKKNNLSNLQTSKLNEPKKSSSRFYLSPRYFQIVDTVSKWHFTYTYTYVQFERYLYMCVYIDIVCICYIYSFYCIISMIYKRFSQYLMYWNLTYSRADRHVALIKCFAGVCVCDPN
jgi:hypothetical protein